MKIVALLPGEKASIFDEDFLELLSIGGRGSNYILILTGTWHSVFNLNFVVTYVDLLQLPLQINPTNECMKLSWFVPKQKVN